MAKELDPDSTIGLSATTPEAPLADAIGTGERPLGPPPSSGESGRTEYIVEPGGNSHTTDFRRETLDISRTATTPAGDLTDKYHRDRGDITLRAGLLQGTSQHIEFSCSASEDSDRIVIPLATDQHVITVDRRQGSAKGYTIGPHTSNVWDLVTSTEPNGDLLCHGQGPQGRVSYLRGIDGSGAVMFTDIDGQRTELRTAPDGTAQISRNWAAEAPPFEVTREELAEAGFDRT